MKLTLRDLLWLALLFASLTTWGIQHRRSSQRAAELTKASVDVLRNPSASPSAAARDRRAALEKFAGLSQEELDRQFAAIATSGQWQHATDYEPCLTEMARRKMADSLQKHYDNLMAGNDPNRAFPYNLELLTALRRAQGKADPLRIEITLGDPAILQIEGPAPVVKAVVTNVDAGQEAVHFTRGGDNRGGRRDRWRAVLTDEWGRVVRDSNFDSMHGGGTASIGPFAFGQTDADGHAFDLRRYVAPARSGKYQLQLIYHNELDISDEPDLSGLIVTKSQPIAVQIQVPEEKGLRPGLQALIAILAASAALTLATVIGNRLHSPRDNAAPGPRNMISRRDIFWNCLLAAVAVGAWQGDRYWSEKIASLQPDAQASWSLAFPKTRAGK